jgi:hypothetical protein
VGFAFDDEPTVNSQGELPVAPSPICPVGQHRTTGRSERHSSSVGSHGERSSRRGLLVLVSSSACREFIDYAVLTASSLSR